MLPTAEPNTIQNAAQVTQESIRSNQAKTVIICGSCGAQERVIDGRGKTECPNCDDYIY